MMAYFVIKWILYTFVFQSKDDSLKKLIHENLKK